MTLVHAAAASKAGAALVSPAMSEEVTFINGLTGGGRVSGNSFWGMNDRTANKWGAPLAGTGATVTFAFDAASNFSVQERTAFRRAFDMWTSVADVTFKEAGIATADVRLVRGSDSQAYEDGPMKPGSGASLGRHTGQAFISIDNSQPGFEIDGSLETAGGYGFSTMVHEVGHLLGLGHAGLYNGDVDTRTQQYSAYDDVMWTTMSYIDWTMRASARYGAGYPVEGTNWGTAADGTQRAGPHTVMQLDVIAIQQIYGAAKTTPFDGGQTYGFHSNIEGSLRQLYDFSLNGSPIVTLYNQGTGNTLDLSGFAQNATVDLRAGAFSSAGGLVNNIAIAQNTLIERAVGGAGNDVITGNAADNRLVGGAGADTLTGLEGNDRLYVDNARDKAVEAEGQGIDTVYASISFSLRGQFAENLYLTGRAAAEATGNGLDNILKGNEGANVLAGNGGDDLLIGAGGADRLVGGDGEDTASYQTATAGVNAGLGAPRTNTGDARGDSFESIENLVGSRFADMLAGDAGSNILAGREGADTLRGGAGVDTFVFDRAIGGVTGNVDVIADFGADEKIALDTIVFRLGEAGTDLETRFFKDLGGVGALLDRDDRILYEGGVLSYDRDGSGASAAVAFAQLADKHALAADDFMVV